jgi:hypothetical protein
MVFIENLKAMTSLRCIRGAYRKGKWYDNDMRVEEEKHIWV